MNKTLLIFSHPRFEQSRANRVLLEAVAEMPSVTVHDLYELYPDFNIDVHREQELLLRHQIIIWQFPIYMYSPPAMLKQWIDLVLEHGWAHGSSGKNLENKAIFTAVTTGGTRQSYGPESFNRYRLGEFLRPLEQTARLCKMIWLPVFALQGTYLLDLRQLEQFASLYRSAIELLSSGIPDEAQLSRHEFLNDWVLSFQKQVHHA